MTSDCQGSAVMLQYHVPGACSQAAGASSKYLCVDGDVVQNVYTSLDCSGAPVVTTFSYGVCQSNVKNSCVDDDIVAVPSTTFGGDCGGLVLATSWLVVDKCHAMGSSYKVSSTGVPGTFTHQVFSDGSCTVETSSSQAACGDCVTWGTVQRLRPGGLTVRRRCRQLPTAPFLQPLRRL